MADNRLFLVHRPTNRAVMLGKRMLEGWYNHPTQKDLEEFFSVTKIYDQDDFILVIENAHSAPCLSDDFEYGKDKDGNVLIYTPEVDLLDYAYYAVRNDDNE